MVIINAVKHSPAPQIFSNKIIIGDEAGKWWCYVGSQAKLSSINEDREIAFSNLCNMLRDNFGVIEVIKCW